MRASTELLRIFKMIRHLLHPARTHGATWLAKRILVCTLMPGVVLRDARHPLCVVLAVACGYPIWIADPLEPRFSGAAPTAHPRAPLWLTRSGSFALAHASDTAGRCVGTGVPFGKERKKTDNPREGWEHDIRRHHTGIFSI